MKCQFVMDMDVDVSTMDDASKANVRWRKRINRKTGKAGLEPYFPAGTVYDHPQAAHFVEVGCAIPADDECRAACADMSAEEMKRRELRYRADAAGIQDPDDRELFFAGVIAGYEKVGDKMAYKPGPNWAAFAQDQADKQAKADEEDV